MKKRVLRTLLWVSVILVRRGDSGMYVHKVDGTGVQCAPVRARAIFIFIFFLFFGEHGWMDGDER